MSRWLDQINNVKRRRMRQLNVSDSFELKEEVKKCPNKNRFYFFFPF